MTTEQEIHGFRGEPAKRASGKYCQPDDDQAPHFRQMDDENAWTLDCYHAHHQRTLERLGHKPLPCTHADGKLYRLTAQQLIDFIAADAGLNVEFRKRKKKELSDKQRTELAERMKRLNAQRNGAVI